MKIDYQILQQEVLGLLDENKFPVLATAADDCVKARAICAVNEGLTVFFLTDCSLDKYKQIEKNPKVAICFANVSIEGLAIVRGQIKDQCNKRFVEQYKRRHPGTFAAYAGIKQNVIIEVKPKRITLWKNEKGKPLRDFLYVEEERANREFYQPEME